jgi:hypothetical protein
MYSYVLLALIGNADEIHWYVKPSEVMYSVKVSEANKIHGNIKGCGASSENLQSLLYSIGYYQ